MVCREWATWGSLIVRYWPVLGRASAFFCYWPHLQATLAPACPALQALPGPKRAAHGNEQRSRASAGLDPAAANCTSTDEAAGSILPAESTRGPTNYRTPVATQPAPRPHH